MGKNKEWVTENLTADYDKFNEGTYTYDPDSEFSANIYTGSAVESVTVPAFDSHKSFTAHTPDMFAVYEYNELKKKYPALEQAWDHYQMVLKMCRAKEAESED